MNYCNKLFYVKNINTYTFKTCWRVTAHLTTWINQNVGRTGIVGKDTINFPGQNWCVIWKVILWPFKIFIEESDNQDRLNTLSVYLKRLHYSLFLFAYICKLYMFHIPCINRGCKHLQNYIVFQSLTVTLYIYVLCKHCMTGLIKLINISSIYIYSLLHPFLCFTTNQFAQTFKFWPT